MLTPEFSVGMVWRNAHTPRCTASEPAKYAIVRFSMLNSGAAWRFGCATAEIRNVVLPERARIFPFVGIGPRSRRRCSPTGRARPLAASSDSGVDLPSTIISPSMPAP